MGGMNVLKVATYKNALVVLTIHKLARELISCALLKNKSITQNINLLYKMVNQH